MIPAYNVSLTDYWGDPFNNVSGSQRVEQKTLRFKMLDEERSKEANHLA